MALAEQLREIDLIRDYVERITAESAPLKADLDSEISLMPGERRLTNIGAFRNYIIEYLRHHPHLREDMSLVVRALSPARRVFRLRSTPSPIRSFGLNMKRYRAEIFDHLLAVVPDFDLRVFQHLPALISAKFTAGQ